jgi:hypothetical protein
VAWRDDRDAGAMIPIDRTPDSNVLGAARDGVAAL